jgi:hypothetical protein
MSNKLHIDTMDARGAAVLSEYLELQGFRYGYNGRACQRRSPSNMRFVTVDRDALFYSGSKGAATDVTWHELTKHEIKEMLKAIKDEALSADVMREAKYHRLSATQYLVVQEFKSEFGNDEYKSMCRNFGKYKEDVSELSGYQLEKCISMMQEQINLLKARRLTGDYTNMSRNHRLVMSKDESKLERVWVTQNGYEMPISKMKDDHLHNTILLIDRSISKGMYRLGGNEDLPELLEMLEVERTERGMPMPLIPIKSLEWRKANV